MLTHWFPTPDYLILSKQTQSLSNLRQPTERLVKEMRDLAPGTVRVFSDRSKIDEGLAGWSYIIQINNQEVAYAKGTLGPCVETYDVELTRVVKGLEKAVSNTNPPLKKIKV